MFAVSPSASVPSASVSRVIGAAALTVLLGLTSAAVAGPPSPNASTPGSTTPQVYGPLGEPLGTPAPATTPAVTAVPAPASPAATPGPLLVRAHTSETGTTMLFWSGAVGPNMPSLIWSAFQEHKATTKRFVLVLNSGGGSVMAGEQVITVLRGIRATHRLDTEVRNGRMCGSMCVFIYLQGQTRTAAPASTWLFHEITRPSAPDAKVPVIDRARGDQLIAKYYPSAGVSAVWTQQMKPMIYNSDYWLTGRDLVEAKSGIVTSLLGNIQARVLVPGGADSQ
jgi:hypothetical protein